MKELNQSHEELSLDQELKSMADSVPDMPEEFRTGWRQAIRAEAEKRPSSPKQAPSSPESRVSRFPSRRWTYLLSAAAALVFLITGTLATRGTLSPRLQKKTSVTNSVSDETSLEGDESPKVIIPGAGMNAPEESFFFDAAFESAENTDFYDSAFENEGNTSLISSTTEGMEKTSSESGATIKTAEGSLTEEESEKNTLISENTADLHPESRQNVNPVSQSVSVSGDNIPEVGFGKQILYFMEDMGAFLLSALPYLIGAGIILLTLIFLRKRKKGNSL